MTPNYFWKKNACGNAPGFGAIFMSNRSTKDECFERKLFGLPHACAEFVKEVKAGMILFLFEYEQKKLYGVFRAVSDGRMDIVPHAYQSTGKKFPAQVCFTVIWNCCPLSEPDFRDAIRENYFAERKFNIGLSKYQVERLLYLFHSVMVGVQKSLSKKQDKKRHSNAMAKVNSSLDPTEDSVVESQATKLVDVPQTLNESTSPFKHPFTTGTSNLFTSLHENITPSSDAIASSCFSGCQPVPLEKESECIDVSSYTASSGLGDYIPLSSPEQFEPTETGQAFSEATCDGHKDSSLAEACIFPMSFGVGDSTQPSSVHNADGGQCDESSPAHQSDSYPRVKGLYSDIPDKKGSVFSRLNLESKASLEKNEDNSEVTESIHEIMKKLQKSHKKWEKANRKTESVVHGIGDRTLKNRSSVFSRLSIALVQRNNVKNWNTWRRETGAKVHADGEVGGCSSENRQKKRRLVSLIIRDELNVDTEIRDRWCLEVQMQPQESSAGKEKGGSCEGSTKSDKSGDNEIGFPPKDIVLSVIYPTTSDGKGEEQGRGLTNMDLMLGKEDGSIANCFIEVDPKPLKTYQRRRRVCDTELVSLVSIETGNVMC
ncbi:uncharacterized protein LOC131330260 [Rhododendron vialii]|uniref:uncharacterized protein LOC131330260 n=1 Tax=Rhododendron vialii TaxID=182163 RepID=UPI00265DCD2C|nr:uncharacterized protein LOC131330260 [Rhododendron vialii]XP_058219771.1 uncharacterized protein LOC131330260 [Rhododendron vialii]